MKSLKYVAMAVLMLVATAKFASARGNKENKKAYVFGVATSFNDSTAYFTAIQELDSVSMVGKTHILANKQEYSYQLREYMGGKGVSHATCVTVNASDSKALMKKYNAMKLRYTKKDKLFIKDIPAADFRYERVVMAH